MDGRWVNIYHSRRPTGRRSHADFRSSRQISYPARDPLTIRRKGGVPAIGDQQSRLSAAEAGDDVDPGGIALGAEGDLGAVRRKRRIMVVGEVGSALDRFAASNMAHPNVEIPSTSAVRGEGKQLPVPGKSGVRSQTRV